MHHNAGAWKADRFEGWGRVEYSDNSVYEGELHAGEREGQVGLLVVHLIHDYGIW